MAHPGRWIVPGLFALLVVAGLAYALVPRPVPADLAAIDTGPLVVTVEDDGETRVRDVYAVSSPVAGRVLRSPVHVGDRVVADGTVVATIVPADPSFLDVRARTEQEHQVHAAEAARAVAEAEVRRNEAELDYARAEHDRQRILFDKGHIALAALERSRMELATHEAALETARAALRQRAFEVETARAALITPADEPSPGDPGAGCCVTVTSPADGVVLRVVQESEAIVAVGAPLVEIGDPRDLEIVTDLLSSEAVEVEPGDAVLITEWGGEGALNGRVRRIEPVGVTKVSALGIEEQRVDVVIDLTDPRSAWGRLGHGFRVEVAVVLWRRDEALRVPLGALFRVEGQWSVFRVENGRARVRRVVIDHVNDQYGEVVEGLARGDTVIVHPSDRIRGGTRVESRNEDG